MGGGRFETWTQAFESWHWARSSSVCGLKTRPQSRRQLISNLCVRLRSFRVLPTALLWVGVPHLFSERGRLVLGGWKYLTQGRTLEQLSCARCPALRPDPPCSFPHLRSWCRARRHLGIGRLLGSPPSPASCSPKASPSLAGPGDGLALSG